MLESDLLFSAVKFLDLRFFFQRLFHGRVHGTGAHGAGAGKVLNLAFREEAKVLRPKGLVDAVKETLNATRNSYA